MATAIRPDEVTAVLKRELGGFEANTDVYEVGTVLQVGDGIARIYGLSKVQAGELLEFPRSSVTGMVLNLEEDNVGAVLFGEADKVKEGDEVRRTKRIASINVSEDMLGRVIDPLGNPIDGNELSRARRMKCLSSVKRLPLFSVSQLPSLYRPVLKPSIL